MTPEEAASDQAYRNAVKGMVPSEKPRTFQFTPDMFRFTGRVKYDFKEAGKWRRHNLKAVPGSDTVQVWLLEDLGLAELALKRMQFR